MKSLSENEYVDRIQNAVDYIEDHLGDDVALVEAAERANWSAFHFMRTFDAVVGMTFREYVRRRRMETAAYSLKFTRKRILDIAQDVGYETQAAFTRAFGAVYGTSPKQYRIAGVHTMQTMRARVVLPKRGEDRRVLMQPKIIGRAMMNIVGVELRTKNDGTNDNGIAQFWERFQHERTVEKISNKIDPNVSYGLCTNMDPKTGEFSYVIGYEVSSENNLPPGLGAFEVPSHDYAVFTARGELSEGRFVKAIQQMWKYAYGEWFANSTEWDRDDGPDFELYEDKRLSDSEAECDIYIPVKRK